MKKCYVCEKEIKNVEETILKHHNLTQSQYDKLTDKYYLVHLKCDDDNKFYDESDIKDINEKDIELMVDVVCVCNECIDKSINE